MKLVIVSGPEATGKTMVGKKISDMLGYPYQSKDMIKEALFDTETRSTWDYSWYEDKAKDNFFNVIEQFIEHGTSAVIESNFIAEDRQRLTKCQNKDTLVSEIYCRTKGLTSFKRFVRRNEGGARHKGHHDRRWYPTVLSQDLLQYFGISWLHKPLGFSERLYIVDSTDFSKIDYEEIVDYIKEA